MTSAENLVALSENPVFLFLNTNHLMFLQITARARNGSRRRDAREMRLMSRKTNGERKANEDGHKDTFETLSITRAFAFEDLLNGGGKRSLSRMKMRRPSRQSRHN